MTHFLKNVIILASVGLCSVSCNNEMPLTETDTTSADDQNKISDIIRDVYGVIHSGTRAELPSYTIKSIETQIFQVPDSLLMEGTRSIDDRSYAIHTISLDFGDREGFTILSDTPGIDHVFYFTESGCVADTANNVALKDMVESAPFVALNILAAGIPHEMTTRASVDIEPLVPFQWHQGYPFNYYATFSQCSSCSSAFYKNHRPIGCLNVAVGQTIATVKKFTGTFYGNRDIDFDLLTKTGNNPTDAEVIQIAHFMSEIAINCQTKFRCDKSEATMEAAAKYLRDLGYKVDHREKEIFNTTRFINYLSGGVPQIISGKGAKGTHAWILDGVKQNNGSYLYHHNWGMGINNCDGWSSAYYYGNLQIQGNPEYMFQQYKENIENLYITL